MFVDFHTHPFHPKIAAKVCEQLHNHYKITPVGNGLAEDLIKRLNLARIDMAVALCAATHVDQVAPANAFAMELGRKYPDRIIPFGAMHPHCRDWQSHLETIRKAGFKGIKFHPDFQGFSMDDPALEPILEETGDELMIMWHVGDIPPPEKNPSCPYKLEALRKKFPRCRFIAAHMGGYRHWEHALKTYIGTPVYIDTSSSVAFMDEALLKEILRRHPRDFVLFGSDYPLFDASQEIWLLEQKAGLKESEIDAILSNGAKALGI